MLHAKERISISIRSNWGVYIVALYILRLICTEAYSCDAGQNAPAAAVSQFKKKSVRNSDEQETPDYVCTRVSRKKLMAVLNSQCISVALDSQIVAIRSAYRDIYI